MNNDNKDKSNEIETESNSNLYLSSEEKTSIHLQLLEVLISENSEVIKLFHMLKT